MYQHAHKKDSENVLVLQGGGSLGAFACGVFKAFEKNDIKFYIIGPINEKSSYFSKSDSKYST